MASEIAKAIQFLSDEKGLEYEEVLEALEIALAAAYRKDFGTKIGNYQVKFDAETGDMDIWDEKIVVEDVDEEVLEKAQEELTALREKAREAYRELTEEETAHLPQFNPKTDIMLKEAKEIEKSAKLGDTLKITQTVPGDFGRMAAMTAKQVIIQKIREAERDNVFEDFKEQVGQIVQGTVHKRDRGGNVLVDLGKITGVLKEEEQVRREQYRPGVRLPFFIMSIEMGPRGPQIELSRKSTKMVQSVFEQEIPEIDEGSVEIKAIARDPGNRSKVAVFTEDNSIDPIGACIGQRGSRITTIIDELGGEKIDVIMWSDDAKEFIKQALSPAKVASVELNDQTKEAAVSVGQDQFSLAIGRGGQNVRLAAELTGWRITVVEDGNEEAVAVSSEDDEDAIKEKLEAEKEGDTVADVADVSEETEVQEEIASEEPPVEAEEPAEK
ncbi:MAG: Transcription elongation factor NusA [Candidatus Magasanikbacteria bacterium GW2011_GWD2_43_18]|nr:MAG: Transcription elongation factor NusA [Candidatus Magasanikbacteria bacterium GW2011_GWC2_42_27]KKT04340.1 MAG: Transcription elongation factor NusA [Candidatus Magasanikbacteria bacterium GW2011_GWD2_43_18]KKT25336.1 MAG: Transcription elongation factor NusA [Candidatus Magasanikbacteria bacterium GW2011_GWA2_43_9]HBB38046.1 transcription termination/antitermination protein NusA [Candidatus Magasanikbacteria bacterium]HCC13981.1 transcription termination/antitermination protein NusA [Ca